MCRHLAYLGQPHPLAAVLLEPPHGLCEQSFAPRCQEHGRVNADGFGIGWWPGAGTPARYRRTVPIWADENLPDLSWQIRSGAILGAVRDATTGPVLDEGAVAPFRSDNHLFSHNGVVQDWRALPDEIDTGLNGTQLHSLEALCDSALVWAMIFARMQTGQDIDAAVSDVIELIVSVRPEARLNLLVMDRFSITATRWGDSLSYQLGAGYVRIASEPSEDTADWHQVQQHHLVRATASDAVVRPLPLAAEPTI